MQNWINFTDSIPLCMSFGTFVSSRKTRKQSTARLQALRFSERRSSEGSQRGGPSGSRSGEVTATKLIAADNKRGSAGDFACVFSSRETGIGQLFPPKCRLSKRIRRRLRNSTGGLLHASKVC